MESPKRNTPMVGSCDLYRSDERFKDSTLKQIKDEILKGAKPRAAAKAAGIHGRTYNIWLENEMFSSFIDDCCDEFFSDIRKDIINDTAEIEDPKQRADVRIKMLERADKEFGTRHVATSEEERKPSPIPGRNERARATCDEFLVQNTEEALQENDGRADSS